MRPLRLALAVLFIACIPVFLVTSNVRWVINAPFLYSYGFDRYGSSEASGIERDELLRVGKAFRDYFNNDQEFLEVRAVRNGVLTSIYNEREIAHMVDVKRLVQGVWAVQVATGAFIGAFLIAGGVMYRRRWLPLVGGLAGWGGALTLGILAIVGLGALVAFDRLFLAFHLISFSNDLWILDPRRDVLLMMFPQGFFFEATMWIVGSTVVEALLLLTFPAVRWFRESGYFARSQEHGSGGS